MSFDSIFVIAIALSLDAFGVALCVGLSEGLNMNKKEKYAMSFGFFQFLFSIIGAYAGFLFEKYIATMPTVVGGALIAVVGVLMIKEGFEKSQECAYLKPGITFILGVSVSIDALVIGFTALSDLGSNALIAKYTLFIGLVTFIMANIALVLGKYLKKIQMVGKYADFIGGIILVLFGMKMMFFH